MLDSLYHTTLKLKLAGKRQGLSSFMQHYNGCHYVTVLNLAFMDFIAWH